MTESLEGSTYFEELYDAIMILQRNRKTLRDNELDGLARDLRNSAQRTSELVVVVQHHFEPDRHHEKSKANGALDDWVKEERHLGGEGCE